MDREAVVALKAPSGSLVMLEFEHLGNAFQSKVGASVCFPLEVWYPRRAPVLTLPFPCTAAGLASAPHSAQAVHSPGLAQRGCAGDGP
jgi:hypothetical protein